MPVSAVHVVGPYEVLGLVGAGGMGEVYKAHDPRLDRTVALKILPESFAHDAARLRRFEQEARTLAALSHPNIVPVFDVGSHAGKPYLVTEFLVGETVRDCLNKGTLPARKAVALAAEIAEALSVAHSKGIIHRDLKPENIFVTVAGRVKVLDFGLAHITPAPLLPGNQGPTLASAAHTAPGVVLGTVGYMSPEQVRGQPVDHRSDIFSFGAVFYEMITGKRAFHRASSIETMNAILTEEPPEITPERPDVPVAVDRILRHCLEKEPERRFESARDLAFDLAALSNPSGAVVQPVATLSRFNLSKSAAAIVLGAAFLIAALFLGMQLRQPSGTHFHKLTFQRGYVFNARFAPDHKTVLYSASWSGNPPEVFSTIPGSQDSRPLGIDDAELLAVSPNGELAVLVRPDLDMAGFLRVGTLARVSVSAGTAPREITENVAGADWAPDGSTLAVLRQDRTNNGDSLEYPLGKSIYRSTRPDWLSHVRISPGGGLVAILQHSGLNDDRGRLLVFDASGKQRFTSQTWAGVSGLAWISDRTLWVAATAPENIARQLFEVDLNGKQRLILEVPGELTLQDVASDGSVLVTVNDRRILMHALTDSNWRDLSWLDRTILDTVSADGSKVLFHEGGQGAGALGMTYIRGIDGSPPVRLAEGYGIDLSPDQKWVFVWVPFVPPKYRLVPTGVGDPKPITTPDIVQPFPFGFARNRSGLIWLGATSEKQPQMFMTALDGSNPQAIAPPGAVSMVVAPNGRYAVYRNQGELQLWDIAQNSRQPVQHVRPDDILLSLGDDGQWVFLARPTAPPALTVLRVNLQTGASAAVAGVSASDLAGIAALERICITPDGKTIVMSYVRHLSELYLMQRGK